MQRLVRRIGGFVTAHPWITLVSVVTITIVLAGFASQQEQVDDAEAGTGEAAEAADLIEEHFGDDTVAVQVVVSSDGRDVVNTDALAAVAALTEAIEQSAAAERLEALGDGPPVLSFLTPALLAAEQLGAGDSGTPESRLDDEALRELQRLGLDEAPDELAARADGLISDSADPPERGLVLVTLDVAGLDRDGELQLQRDLETAVDAAEVPDGIEVEVFSFGLLLDSDVGGDVARLFGIAVAVILVILAGVYWVRPGPGRRAALVRRTAADVLLTLAAVVLAIVWMQGTGVLLGPDFLGLIGYFAPQTQVVPILIVALGVDYAIHFTDRYRDELSGGTPSSEAVRSTAATVGVALVLASVTTAAGFLTNLVSPIESLATLGVLSAVGILAALVMTLTFFPAARGLLDARAERRGTLPRESFERATGDRLSRVAGATSVLARRVPLPTVVVALVLAGAGVWGFTQIDTEFSFTDFVPQDSPRLDTFEMVESEFGGDLAGGTDVLLTGPVDTPEAHNALVTSIESLDGLDSVATLAGRADADSPVSVLARGMADDDEVAAAARAAGVTDDLRVDDDADVASLYATMLERIEDAGDVLADDLDGGTAVRVAVRTDDSDDAPGAIGSGVPDDLDRAFEPVAGTGVDVVATSDDIIAAELSEDIRSSQLLAMALAMTVAVTLLALYFGLTARRPLLGALTVVPVALVIAWTFGAMALTGIPLTPVTATLAALAIGIGIDFAIHVLNRYLEARDRRESVADALHGTATSTGAALIGSAVTTLAGFGVLLTSDIVPFQQLGAVTAFAIGFSLLAAVLVFPSVLALADRRRGE